MFTCLHSTMNRIKKIVSYCRRTYNLFSNRFGCFDRNNIIHIPVKCVDSFVVLYVMNYRAFTNNVNGTVQNGMECYKASIHKLFYMFNMKSVKNNVQYRINTEHANGGNLEYCQYFIQALPLIAF